MIREALAGKRILLTGVTGFLGTALLERLLIDTEVARIDCVSRGDAQSRVRAILDGAVFGPAKQRLGEERVRDMFDSRVRAIGADLTTAAPEIADDIDIVIHSAATVSFDPPIHEAFETNLLGTTRLYSAASGRPFIHVSTAYVAGITRGTQPEELLDREVDPRIEAAAAQQMRVQIEEESRRPEALERFEARARHLIGRAGPQSIARKAEALRVEWVNERLVRAGRARARSLGWPDVYAFTKALTEKALHELAGESPLTIVRPSIIESAHRHPFPGWIEGFRVAEPVILAYGRGALPEFPGIPEGVLDIIPVDHVVACVLAAAAEQLTTPKHRAVYHCSSGNRNPFPFRRLYELTREYFMQHPLPERGRGSFKVPVWTFPGRRAVETKMRLAERGVEVAERVVGRLGRNGRAREAATRVDRMRARLDFVKKYAGLYGSYVEVEVIYTDDRARALYESLPDADRDDFCFDPAAFTWEEYFQGIHLPAITAPMRWLSSTPKRPEPKVTLEIPEIAAGPSEAGGPARAPAVSDEPVILACFDVEGTIVSTNVLEAYLWLRLSESSGFERGRELAALARKVPGFLKAEARDRGEFLRRFYREYEGADAELVRKLATEAMPELFLRKLSAAAVRRIKQHRDAGHRIVFITGALDFVVEPLRELADEVVTARLRERDGVFTGDMERPPLVGEARASWVRDAARRLGADLSRSYAYADSLSDLPMLESVGNGVAVNPDIALARIAKKRRWPVEAWEAGKGTPRILLPEPVR